MSLLTVGSVAFDKLETPFGKTDKIIGGAATFITLTASYFVKENNLVAVVGEDFPQEMIDTLVSHGVNVDGLEIRKGEKSFFWHGRYHNDMNSRDTVEVQLNVMENFDPKIPESYQGCEFLMLGNTAPAIQHLVLKRLATRPKFVLLDTMNLWIDIALDDLKALLKDVDCVTIKTKKHACFQVIIHCVVRLKQSWQWVQKHLLLRKVNTVLCCSKVKKSSSVQHYL